MRTRRTRWAGRRAEQRGYSVCPVVNENGIVLGVIGKRDWDTDPTASVQQLMDSAPTTLRPSDPLEKAQKLLQKIDHGAVLITDSDGKLLGHFSAPQTMKKPAAKSRGRNQRSGLDEDKSSRDALGSKRHFAGFVPERLTILWRGPSNWHQFRSIRRRQI